MLKSEPKELVFLIHGIMGHPEEFSPMIPVLTGQGFDTHRVCLPQHGDEPGNLAATTWEEMLDHCQQELIEQSGRYDRVHLLGFSLGGALSVLLAENNASLFETLTLVAAPSRPVFNLEFGQTHLRYFFKRFLPGTQYLSQADTGFPKPVMHPMHLPRFFQQMEGLFTEVQSRSPRLDMPTLLIHSPYDLTVPYDHSEWLYRNLGGDVNFLTLLNCGHQVFPYNIHGPVSRAVLDHLGRLHPAVLSRQTGIPASA